MRLLCHQKIAGDIAQMRDVDCRHRVGAYNLNFLARLHARESLARFQRGEGTFKPFQIKVSRFH